MKEQVIVDKEEYNEMRTKISVRTEALKALYAEIDLLRQENNRLKRLDENVKEQIENLKDQREGQTSFIRSLIDFDIKKLENLYDE